MLSFYIYICVGSTVQNLEIVAPTTFADYFAFVEFIL